jgi:hypothetical protein
VLVVFSQVGFAWSSPGFFLLVFSHVSLNGVPYVNPSVAEFFFFLEFRCEIWRADSDAQVLRITGFIGKCDISVLSYRLPKNRIYILHSLYSKYTVQKSFTLCSKSTRTKAKE